MELEEERRRFAEHAEYLLHKLVETLRLTADKDVRWPHLEAPFVRLDGALGNVVGSAAKIRMMVALKKREEDGRCGNSENFLTT